MPVIRPYEERFIPTYRPDIRNYGADRAAARRSVEAAAGAKLAGLGAITEGGKLVAKFFEKKDEDRSGLAYAEAWAGYSQELDSLVQTYDLKSFEDGTEDLELQQQFEQDRDELIAKYRERFSTNPDNDAKFLLAATSENRKAMEKLYGRVQDQVQARNYEAMGAAIDEAVNTRNIDMLRETLSMSVKAGTVTPENARGLMRENTVLVWKGEIEDQVDAYVRSEIIKPDANIDDIQLVAHDNIARLSEEKIPKDVRDEMHQDLDSKIAMIRRQQDAEWKAQNKAVYTAFNDGILSEFEDPSTTVITPVWYRDNKQYMSESEQKAVVKYIAERDGAPGGWTVQQKQRFRFDYQVKMNSWNADGDVGTQRQGLLDDIQEGITKGVWTDAEVGNKIDEVFALTGAPDDVYKGQYVRAYDMTEDLSISDADLEDRLKSDAFGKLTAKDYEHFMEHRRGLRNNPEKAKKDDQDAVAQWYRTLYINGSNEENMKQLANNMYLRGDLTAETFGKFAKESENYYAPQKDWYSSELGKGVAQGLGTYLEQVNNVEDPKTKAYYMDEFLRLREDIRAFAAEHQGDPNTIRTYATKEIGDSLRKTKQEIKRTTEAEAQALKEEQEKAAAEKARLELERSDQMTTPKPSEFSTVPPEWGIAKREIDGKVLAYAEDGFAYVIELVNGEWKKTGTRYKYAR